MDDQFGMFRINGEMEQGVIFFSFKSNKVFLLSESLD